MRKLIPLLITSIIFFILSNSLVAQVLNKMGKIDVENNIHIDDIPDITANGQIEIGEYVSVKGGFGSMNWSNVNDWGKVTGTNPLTYTNPSPEIPNATTANVWIRSGHDMTLDGDYSVGELNLESSATLRNITTTEYGIYVNDYCLWNGIIGTPSDKIALSLDNSISIEGSGSAHLLYFDQLVGSGGTIEIDGPSIYLYNTNPIKNNRGIGNELTYQLESGAFYFVGANSLIDTYVNYDFNGSSNTGTGNIVWNSNSSQSIYGSTTYNNLTIRGNGIKTADGDITVSGKLLLDETATFNAGGYSLTYNNGTLEYAGSSPRTTSDEELTDLAVGHLNNIIINNTSGVTLHEDLTFSGTITFLSGIFNTNGNIVDLGTDGTLSQENNGSHLVGSVKSTRNSQQVNDWGIGFKITAYTSGGSASTEIARYNGLGSAVTVGGSEGINRKFVVTDGISNGSKVFDGSINIKWLPGEDNNKGPAGMGLWYLEEDDSQYYKIGSSETVSSSPRVFKTSKHATSLKGTWTATEDINPLPVELTLFTAEVFENTVKLNWQTALEVNNYGFEIERTSIQLSPQSIVWETIGFVEGSGNSSSPKSYEFIDEMPLTDSAEYRLKQIDTDGKFTYYSKTVKVKSSITDVEKEILPTEFSLSQNYPNPFNPSTTISYSIPTVISNRASSENANASGDFSPQKSGFRNDNLNNVTLKIYNILGQEVATLVNKEQSPGSYEVMFDASYLNSGVYIYRMQAGSFSDIRKMVLLK